MSAPIDDSSPVPGHEGGRSWGAVQVPPPLAGLPERADVVVVGGGISGVTTAVLLRRAGAHVVLLEARRVGSGTSGGTTGKASLLQGSTLQGIRRRHDDDVLREYAAHHEAAQTWIRQQAEGEPSVAAPRAAWTYSTSTSGRRTVEREAEAMAAAGVPVQWVEDTELPFETTGAIRLDDQLQLHPVRYLQRLVDELCSPPLPGEGEASVHEGVRVTSVGDRGPCVVRGRAGDVPVTVHADQVVVATLLPFLDRSLTFARAEPTRSYCLTARLGGPAPSGMYLGVDSPTRSLRTAGDPHELLVGGNSHPVGRGGPTGPRLADLRTWTSEHFDVERVVGAWSAQDYSTADRLPYVGPVTPGSNRVFIATGFAKWGMTGGTAAALQLAQHLYGAETTWPWHPWRTDLPAQAVGSARMNTAVGSQLVQGWGRTVVRRPRPRRPAEGCGLVRAGVGGPKAVSTVDGTTRAVSGVCTHLGGIVRWNDFERSWDCPLHGSRFDADGTVLEAPAVKPLS